MASGTTLHLCQPLWLLAHASLCGSLRVCCLAMKDAAVHSPAVTSGPQKWVQRRFWSQLSCTVTGN